MEEVPEARPKSSPVLSTSWNIAVVGAGIAGIAAAHLLARRHRVTLLEQSPEIGGHTHTVTDGGVAVDAGFIVFNDRTYPRFRRFLDELGVESCPSDMSFGYHCRRSGLQYGGHNLATLFAQPVNACHPDFLRLVLDMLRFNRHGQRLLQNGGAGGLTLGEFVRRYGYSQFFLRHYLVPLGASLWSAPADRMLEFPASTYLAFFANHGLLSLTDRPLWRTVTGGGRSYLQAFLERFPGEVQRGRRVVAVERGEGVTLRCEDGEALSFDRAVLACHADEALRVLGSPSRLETQLLSPWVYEESEVVVHQDRRVMPPLPAVWSSWNYVREERSPAAVTITYFMNRLQRLDTDRPYFVTLNGQVPENNVVARLRFSHPQFDLAAVSTQSRLRNLNDQGPVFFCGSYFGYGFHEDAFASGAAVARRLGVDA